ncbi:MAG TPA: 4Fe-4S dicluster domain-containing protein [Myxococcales bacterium]|nr:4Fe-4S dicluster domain-containing protein [Myxococcales bacterium]
MSKNDKIISPVPENPGRRRFLGLMGASAATTSMALGGCSVLRKPVENILPYAKRPEDLIPGNPMYFATSMNVGDAVLGLLVESQEGRPTKVDGNPSHPMSMGAANAWAQASILDLYDEDRGKHPLLNGKESDMEAAEAALTSLAGKLAKNGGDGVGILSDWTPSPTLWALFADFKRKYPKAKLYSHDPMHTGNSETGASLAGAKGRIHPVYTLDSAQVIVSLDADLFGTDGDSVRAAYDFAGGRKVEKPGDGMNRLYVVESGFTNTGSMADNRLRLPASQIGAFVAALHNALKLGDVPTDGPLSSDSKVQTWVTELAKDLAANRGRSAVVVGPRQPAWVHGLVHLLNQKLGNLGKTVHYMSDADAPDSGTLADLSEEILTGRISTLVMMGGNPAYSTSSDLKLAARISQVPISIHLSYLPNQTSQACTWYIPQSHYLESWGDLRANDGTVSIQQPLIAPLFKSLSAIEFLARLTTNKSSKGYDLVRAHWAGIRKDGFEKMWRKSLHDGVVADSATKPAVPSFSSTKALKKSVPKRAEGKGLEVNFVADTRVADGRFGNNPWLQELPDPMSKITWDNAAIMNAKTAAENGIASYDLVQITVNGRSLKIAAFVAPGVADGVVIIPLGYGQSAGRTAKGVGFNAYTVQSSASPRFSLGAGIKSTGGKYKLALTQVYGSQKPPGDWEPRPLVRENTLEGFNKRPNFVEDDEVLPKEKLKSLWEQPNETGGQQWGMSIDLNACNGCGACTIACQSENNISVVGKDEVMNGREMHWIRLDRYYTGTDEEPQAVMQPTACAHCETAPCENVCPVAATAHSPEGLNDIAYNRCIGTRYCANNCPTKVRRFNFFNYAKRNDQQLGKLSYMQRNPDVTVRFRGVIEKCTYCVQRINEAKIDAKAHGNGVVPDGGIVPACSQTCPTKAISFGDINDAKSEVSVNKASSRNYGVLSELNIHPRTTYLAKLRNPNPALV